MEVVIGMPEAFLKYLVGFGLKNFLLAFMRTFAAIFPSLVIPPFSRPFAFRRAVVVVCFYSQLSVLMV
jgi:hypothetical protein